MDEGHVNTVRQGRDEAGNQTGFGFGYGNRLNLHFGLLGAGYHIRPEGGERGAQIGGGHVAKICVRMDFQPHQQRFFRQNIL